MLWDEYGICYGPQFRAVAAVLTLFDYMGTQAQSVGPIESMLASRQTGTHNRLSNRGGMAGTPGGRA